MSRPRIKICGITTPEDAVACHALGVEHLGVIFADSPRNVTPERARGIRMAVPTASLVGVFADSTLGDVVAKTRFAGLDLIQLHGRKSPAYCTTLSSCTLLPLIKSLADGQAGEMDLLSEFRSADYFLFDLDKHNPDEDGSVEILWTRAAQAMSRGFRVFLAGGLEPANVREAVRRVRPFCVDVCRGVEKAPGIKDPEAVRRFIEEVRL